MLSPFAETIFNRTYRFDEKETWEGCAARVAKFVADGDKESEKKFFEVIASRKFIPGGRYLYASGREVGQVNNCFLLRAEDSREGWGKLLDAHVCALSTGGGVGTNYTLIRPSGTPIKRFGGVASGPVSLMMMVNEVARHVMAGGSRRSALWAGLAWDHPDVLSFIETKNWTTSVKALKEKDFSFPAPLDMTNISVCLDDRFFKEVKKDEELYNLYYKICKSMCKTGEPGFSIDLGAKSAENLRNPCVPYRTLVLTPNGLRPIGEVIEGDKVWTGKRFASVVKKFNNGIKPVYKFKTTGGVFEGTSTHKVLSNGIKTPVAEANSIDTCVGPVDTVKNRSPIAVMDGLLIGDGSVHKASNNLIYLCVGTKDQDYFDSEVSSCFIKDRSKLGIGAWEVQTSLEPEDLGKTWTRTIPQRYMKASADVKKAFLRGLFSANGSCIVTSERQRIALKQTSEVLVRQAQIMLSSIGIRSYITTNSPTEIEHKNGMYTSKQSFDLNIVSDRALFMEHIGFIQAYKNMKLNNGRRKKVTFDVYGTEYLADEEVFDITVNDPDHTYWADGMLISNCTEVVSADSFDCCNLGSINLPRIESIDELKEITKIAVKFLYKGTLVGWMPKEAFATMRDKNRRIGLGIMGLHDWCLKHGLSYEPSGELGKWLSCWANVSDSEAKKVAKQFGGPAPKGVRAIAPTGTIAIIGETTSGIEPIYCVAYKRRFLEAGKTKYTYVIDPTADRAVNEYGIDPDEIEDSVSLAKNVERRIAMQAFVQDFVDQAISSTINMPEWGEPGNNNAKQFADTLLKYLPRLRGITVYPDGARAGQPITPIKYDTAKKHKDVVYEEDQERCAGGVCGV